MVFFARKVLRKVAGNRTFVVVTDRVELAVGSPSPGMAPGFTSKKPAAAFCSLLYRGQCEANGAQTGRPMRACG